MVLFFSSTTTNPPTVLYMGKDKVENEDLIKYALPTDIWFHVDKLSSAHVYLRMSPTTTIDAIPPALIVDCAQLVKANSIEGNKKDNIAIVYTPADNLKKTGDMVVGQVGFHKENRVKRTHVPVRENPIVNRLNKTKVERQVDHEAERIARQKEEGAKRRAAALVQQKAEAELAEARKAEKAARSYDLLFAGADDDVEESEPRKSAREMEEDFM